MKTLIYQVYTGKRSKLYDHCTASVRAYAEKIEADYIVQRAPILMIKPDVFQTNRKKESYEKYGGFLPIYEKENAFGYFDRYDQIAIIDADVYVRPECKESIFDSISPDSDFGGVLERSIPLFPINQQKIADYSRKQYGMKRLSHLFNWDSKGADFYNMGVMVMNKSISKYLNGETPKQFIQRPEFKDFVDGLGEWKWSTDQTMLNYWIRKENMKVTDLHWKWNTLYSVMDLDNLKKGNFIHFFKKQSLPMNGENIEQLIKVI